MTCVETAAIEGAVRLLAQRKPENDPPGEQARHDPNTEEILLDIEVDGTRYLLIRLPKPADLQVRLSPREKEIVRLVALGHSNKIIADVLNISSWTVCTHLRRIFAKLAVGSRAAMVAKIAEIRRTPPPLGLT